MAAESQLATLGSQLHAAVTGGHLAEAARLVDTYSGCLREYLRDSTNEQGKQQISTALELLEWARRTCLASRSQAAQQYAESRARAPYQSQYQPPAGTFDLRG